MAVSLPRYRITFCCEGFVADKDPDALYDVYEYYAQNNTSPNHPRHIDYIYNPNLNPNHPVDYPIAHTNCTHNDTNHRQDYYKLYPYEYMDTDAIHLGYDSDWSSADVDYHTYSAPSSLTRDSASRTVVK